MGHLAEQARTNQPEARPKQHDEQLAAQPNAATERRLGALPAELDAGEQIVGSDHVFALLMPYNIGHRGTAGVSVAITGDPAFSIRSFKAELEESGRLSGDSLQDQLEHPIVVGYAPTHRGQSEAALTLVACWSDGHIEQQQVRVIGRARELDDAPTASPADIAQQHAQEEAQTTRRAREEQAYADPEWRGGHIADGIRSDFDSEVDLASRHAAKLAGNQSTGVTVVESEVGTYVAPPVERPLWETLAEVAISLACGAIADGVAKTLALKLGEQLVSATKDSNFVGGLASLIKMELTNAAAAAVSALKSSSPPSTDPKTAFFEQQCLGLTTLADKNTAVIDDRKKYLMPVLASDPALATQTMHVLAETLESQLPLAELHQKQATAAQWFAFKAQYSNGSQALGRDTVVTDLGRARPAHPSVDPRALAGVIDIHVDLEHGPVHAVAAYSRGVAQAAAHDLDDLDLATAHVPLRLILGADEPEPTIVTRDEAGRIRVSGDLGRLSEFDDRGQRPDNEIQAERAARAVCELVLARPLAGWGVSILTDDQTAKGKPHV